MDPWPRCSHLYRVIISNIIAPVDMDLFVSHLTTYLQLIVVVHLGSSGCWVSWRLLWMTLCSYVTESTNASKIISEISLFNRVVTYRGKEPPKCES